MTADAASADFSVVSQREGLLITHASGEPDRHVVSFTGIGLGLQGIQQEEWRRSLGNGTLSVTYVTDSKRYWFNDASDEIVDVLRPILHGNAITLGNSMGGFGAFYFASLLPHVTRAVAFSPQFSVNPIYMPPSERRWAEYRNAIKEHRITHLMQHPSSTVEYCAFFGNDRQEREHFSRLAIVATPLTYIFVLKDCDHRLVGELKRAGIRNRGKFPGRPTTAAL